MVRKQKSHRFEVALLQKINNPQRGSLCGELSDMDGVGNLCSVFGNHAEINLNGVACPVGGSSKGGFARGSCGTGGAEHGFAFVGVEN